MDKTRFVLGVMLIVGVPPAIIFWLFIHPLVGFWRKAGPWVAYTIVGLVCTGVGLLIYRLRREVLGADFGTNWVLILLAFVPYGAAAWMSVITKRQLKLRTFAGLQELSEADSGGVLLQEGIYGHIRHPRYLSVILGTAGFSMFVNFAGGYLTVLASIPALYLVTILEERELAQRFGAEFEQYRSRVPAIFPRFSK